MSSNFTCCGCWPSFIQGITGTISGTTKTGGRTYRRAKYNEREYSIEFENLIEEEDFYAPSQHAVTEVERDLLSRRKFGELLAHEKDINREQEAKLKEREENARMEDEAYIQAKREASRVARQAMKRQINEKSKFPNMQKFDSVEFSKWLSEEKIDITSPELDVEDFESFLEKVRAKSAQALEDEGKKKDASVFEQTLSQGLAATKLAGDALNALQPVELHAVGMPAFHETPDVETRRETVEFDCNFTEYEDSELLDIPDVKIKSDDTVIVSSQLPESAAPLVAERHATSQDSQNVLVDMSRDTTCDSPIDQLTQPLATPTSRPSEIESPPETLVTFASDVSEAEALVTFASDVTAADALVTFASDVTEADALVTFASDVSEAEALDSASTDSVSTQLPSVDNSADNQHIFDNTLTSNQINNVDASMMADTDERLIDISPDKEESPAPGVESHSSLMPTQNADDQCALSYDNQCFEDILHEEAQDEDVNPVEELPDLQSPPILLSDLNSPPSLIPDLHPPPALLSGLDSPPSLLPDLHSPPSLIPDLHPPPSLLPDLYSPPCLLPDMHSTPSLETEETPSLQVSSDSTEFVMTESQNCITSSSEVVPIETVAMINTPRNVATNLKPVENGIDDLHTVTNDIEVSSFKMVTPAANESKSQEIKSNEFLEDSLNDDDDFNDFEDEFVSSNSNALFEDYLT